MIYDYEYRRQTILQGHCNVIACCAVSSDKRWIVTADKGPDSILVVWDSYSGTPVKTIFSPHKDGCIALDISNDSLFVVTLSAPTPVSLQSSYSYVQYHHLTLPCFAFCRIKHRRFPFGLGRRIWMLPSCRQLSSTVKFSAI